MGSGGLVVMDETTCMVDMAKFFLRFTQDESCGKCTFCRIGTKRMLEILERITDGNGVEGDVALLQDLAYQIRNNTICGLGQTAPNPVLTTLKYFPEEYEAHIRDKKCPAHSCSALLTYTIKTDACKGCMLCAKACPSEAIKGEKKKPHEIDPAACVKCGKCFETCKFGAVLIN
jgi:NAD-dependent dihydropyrimidine dehydrogenase PreA subunit